MMFAVRARLGFLIVILSIQFTASAQDSLLNAVINKQSLEELISFISADSMYGRFTGTAGNQRAAAYIADQLEKAGAFPVAGNEGYLMPFVVPPVSPFYQGDIGKAYNIVSALPGKSKPHEVIIFSAHYDHIGTAGIDYKGGKPSYPEDRIYNGANDNASGVAAMIALARYFGKLKNNERTLMFIAFSGEELGLFGSRALASDFNPNNIIAMLNLEMLGGSGVIEVDDRVPGNNEMRNVRNIRKAFITGDDYSNLLGILNTELFTVNRKKFGEKFFGTDNENLFHRSDNLPFAEQGVPAHSIMASSSHDVLYHSVDDEVETLNIKKMADIVQAIALAARPIINGTATPTRIDPRRL